MFQLCGTQRRFNALGQFAGFDYAGVRAAAALTRKRITPELFTKLRVLEMELIEVARQKGKQDGNPH